LLAADLFITFRLKRVVTVTEPTLPTPKPAARIESAA
jgi:hypothetical protein